jgi:hypothetical protein
MPSSRLVNERTAGLPHIPGLAYAFAIVADVPHFSYPGGKARHAKRIVSLFPPVGDRFVDVFAGRGNITWAVMSMLNYRSYWINALGTIDFFREIRFLGPAPVAGQYLFKDRTREFYEKSKAETVGANRQQLIPQLEQIIAAHPEVDFTQPAVAGGKVSVRQILGWLKEAQAKATEKHNRQPASLATECYVSRDGGTYNSRGASMRTGSGITKQGMSRLFYGAGVLLEKNWKRTKLTAIDYRDVLAQCRPGDMVYL